MSFRKRFALVTALGLLLVGVAVAALPVPPENQEGKNGEERLRFVKTVEGELSRWEARLDEIKGQRGDYQSIEKYMLADDLELLMKDVRGDLAKWELSSGGVRDALGAEIAEKLSDLRRNGASLEMDKDLRSVVSRE